jgi:hypothetical protein
VDLPIYLVSAAAAFGLMEVRRENARLSRREYLSTVRPVLLEIPHQQDEELELVRFGAPRHNSVEIGLAETYLGHDEVLLQVSVPFRNAGQGAAVITRATTEPHAMGSVVASRSIVPVGGRTRVSASLLVNSAMANREFASGHFTINIEYTDADGNQPMVSRAHIHHLVGEPAYVGPIDVSRRGESAPFVSSRVIETIHAS